MQKLVESEIRTPLEASETRTRDKLVEVPVCPSCGLELRKNYKGQWFCLECNVSFADSKLSLRIAEEKAEFLVFSGLRDQLKADDLVDPRFATTNEVWQVDDNEGANVGD